MSHRNPNHLISESSPYLLQHAYNPVDWHPWGEEALEKARRENKLLIISVGYAACHWCHVMEHESFEDDEVAAIQNAHFVSIKVDREERPDIDQIYMDAVQLMTGQGGWPLNCVALPDGRPIWGGTYFRKGQWMDILTQLAELWERRPDEAVGYAERLTDAVGKMDAIVPVAEAKPFEAAFLGEIIQKWKPMLDLRWGGQNRAPKFPMPNSWIFLLREGIRTGDQELLAAVEVTLRRMAWGGIYDQIGGGFARYSVDGLWKVPHFEKMTYDNGQLMALYAEAFRHRRDPIYERVVEQTLAFMQREMASPEGGWYSSLDADSEGVEGKFYVWRKAEVDAVLGPDSGWWSDYYQVTEAGNWEHGNSVLMVTQGAAEFAAKRGLSEEAFEKRLEVANALMLTERSKRIRPGLDDKVLASWNALMLRGLVEAYRTWGKSVYLETAKATAGFLTGKMLHEGHLFRNYKSGKASIPAFLDDYALVADALLALYQVDFELEWLHAVEGLVNHVRAHFYNPATQLFFFTSDEDPALIARKTESMDNVIPASNSVMAHVLHDFGHIQGRQELVAMAERMLQNMQADMPRYGAGYSNWALLMQKFVQPFLEIVVTGLDALEVARELDRHPYGNKVLIAAVSEESNAPELLRDRFQKDKTLIYICEGNVCHLPTEDLAVALQMMDSFLPKHERTA